ncbi:mCG144940, partial [Mus musculus]
PCWNRCGFLGGSMSLCRQDLRTPSSSPTLCERKPPPLHCQSLLAALGLRCGTLDSFSCNVSAWMPPCFLLW